MKEYYNINNNNIPYELIDITNDIATLRNKNITIKTNIKNIQKTNYINNSNSHLKDYTV